MDNQTGPASKFNEVTTPMLHELQMEGLVHRFHQSNVLKMELVMLKVLDWRVNSVTSYSFAQTLVSKMGLVGDHMVMNYITNHLLEDLCDMQMLRYSPSVVAAAAMWIVLEEEGLGGRIMDILGQEHKENIVKCVDMMKSRTMDYATSIRKSWEAKKSLVSVLQRGDVMNGNGDCPIEDLSAIFQILQSDNKKRDREVHQYNIPPAKRMAI